MELITNEDDEQAEDSHCLMPLSSRAYRPGSVRNWPV